MTEPRDFADLMDVAQKMFDDRLSWDGQLNAYKLSLNLKTNTPIMPEIIIPYIWFFNDHIKIMRWPNAFDVYPYQESKTEFYMRIYDNINNDAYEFVTRILGVSIPNVITVTRLGELLIKNQVGSVSVSPFSGCVESKKVIRFMDLFIKTHRKALIESGMV